MDREEGLEDAAAASGALIVQADAERAMQLGRALVVLPIRRDNAGRGIYPDAATFLVKELRGEGVDAAFLDDAPHRLFLVQKSAALDLLSQIVIGVASSAAWDGLKLLFSKRPPKGPLTVTYLDLSREGHRRQFTATGPSDAVLQAIEQMRESGGGSDVES